VAKRTLLLALLLAVTGCSSKSSAPAEDRDRPVTPAPATRSVTSEATEPRKVEKSREVTCERRFDDNEAGFQTCVDGGGEPPTPE
jgi:hypothetical protein